MMAIDWSLKLDIDHGDQVEIKRNGQTKILAPSETGWSVANAVEWSGRLTDTDNPGEKDALRKFLSIYSLTRDDGSPDVANGGWEDIVVQNGDAVKRSLFGEGDGTAIQAVFIGMDGKNTYPRMREILTALGLKNKPSGGDHHTHFHIDFRTPKLEKIDGKQKLLASSAGENFWEGEDQMLLEAMLLASAMSGVAEPVGTQVTAESKAPVRTSYVAGMCQTMEMQRPVGNNEMSQSRRIGIEHAAMDYVREQLGRDADLPLPSAVTVERYPENGMLNVGYKSMNAEHGGRQYWRYTPNPSFIGTDRAQFVVDVQGTLVRVVVVVKIVEAIGTEEHKDGCKIWHWIISESDKDSDGIANVAVNQTQLGTLLTAASQTLSFADLSGSSVGQATGTGANAQITLDTDAAGHGWYIDQTPYLNDEYLPTSNPNVNDGACTAWRLPAAESVGRSHSPISAKSSAPSWAT